MRKALSDLLSHRAASLSGVLISAVLTGCTTVSPVVPEAVKLAHPDNIPKPTVTNFNAALACMDDLMLVEKVAPIFISSEGINNYTSDRTLSSGGKEMLITALSRMSTRSEGVKFVSFGSDIQNMMTLQGAHPQNSSFRIPDYFIRGGVTQFNKSLWSGQKGSGASVEIESPDVINRGTFFTLLGQEDLTSSYSASSSYGTVSLDLSAGFIANLQIIPGITSANTLALQSRKGRAVNADLTLGDLGYSFNLSGNQSFDFNDIYRSLVQVGAIEIVGKLQKIPYWKCLANAGTVKSRNAHILDSYQSLKAADGKKLIELTQQRLHTLGYYSGKVDGVLGPATQEALQYYQRQFNLVASGQLDYETYRMMNLFSPVVSSVESPWWQGYQFNTATSKVSPQ